MKTLGTISAALLLAMSVSAASAQSADTEKGPISHPTAAPGNGPAPAPGPTNPSNPGVTKAPDASAATKASTLPSARRPDTTTNNPAQKPSPN